MSNQNSITFGYSKLNEKILLMYKFNLPSTSVITPPCKQETIKSYLFIYYKSIYFF